MKKYLFLFLLLSFSLCPSYILAQADYKGKVVDLKTKEPIPYVNIGIVGEGYGTVSDEEGLFHLPLNKNEFDKEATIQFSSLGYKPYEIKVWDAVLVYNEYPEIVLEPTAMELDEVVVSNKGGVFISDAIGYRNYGQQAFGYWKGNIALGGELATKIISKRGLRRLERFNFEVWHNPSDSLLLRVNVYDDDGLNGVPKTNLNKSGKSILCTVHKNDRLVRVDLTPFTIYATKDFIISLELLKIFGESELGLMLAASAYGQNGSFRKYASQDKWEKIDNRNMAYYLETSLMVSEKVAKRLYKKEARKKKKTRTISGFAIKNGRMVAGVEVTNRRTNETVFTDANGRYTIGADKNDQVFFSKQGLKAMVLTVGDKTTANIIMKELTY